MRMYATLISLVLLSCAGAVYADENPAVTQGAKGYDWQECVYTKMSDCINNCQNSEDMNCPNTCPDLAKDKCQSEGLTPQQDPNTIDSPQ